MTEPIVIVENCKRCGKRPPTNPDWSRTWNDTWIAGLHAGRLCPACQTGEEDLEAQVRDAADTPLKYRPPSASVDDWIGYMVPELTRMYRTPEKLRAKADELDAVRQDQDAQTVTGLMRALAKDLEVQP